MQICCRKMEQMKSIRVFFTLFHITIGISASTHWAVTENGRIQNQLDSPFHLRRPHDLIAFLDQDDRKTKIESLYKELVSRKSGIDEQWAGIEGATDLETRLYQTDNDCISAGQPLSDVNLYTTIAADGTGREGINLDDLFQELEEEVILKVPECKHAFPLDFSMFAFEHLNAMVGRANLTMSPEHVLLQWLPPNVHLYEFGHQVATKLATNHTSWLLYNLGAMFWRIQGNAPNAMECSRRAVHFAPRQYRDIALSNLGNIFHQSKHPGEAAIVLHAAIDHDPLRSVNHLALGNVYAVLADYNRSVACYDNCLKLSPDKTIMERAIKSKHSVLCHRKLEMGLMELHESLQGILAELHDYHSRQEQWLQLQEKLVWEQAPLESRLFEPSAESLSALLSNRGQTCTARSGTGEHSAVLSCDVKTESQMLAHNLHIDITMSLQLLLRNVETQAKKISTHMSKPVHNQGFAIEGNRILRKESFLHYEPQNKKDTTRHS